MPRSYTKCNDCEEKIPANKFSHIRAGDKGWFFEKDGTVYCPNHTPGWVSQWRLNARKND